MRIAEEGLVIATRRGWPVVHDVTSQTFCISEDGAMVSMVSSLIRCPGTFAHPDRLDLNDGCFHHNTACTFEVIKLSLVGTAI